MMAQNKEINSESLTIAVGAPTDRMRRESKLSELRPTNVCDGQHEHSTSHKLGLTKDNDLTTELSLKLGTIISTAQSVLNSFLPDNQQTKQTKSSKPTISKPQNTDDNQNIKQVDTFLPIQDGTVGTAKYRSQQQETLRQKEKQRKELSKYNNCISTYTDKFNQITDTLYVKYEQEILSTTTTMERAHTFKVYRDQVGTYKIHKYDIYDSQGNITQVVDEEPIYISTHRWTFYTNDIPYKVFIPTHYSPICPFDNCKDCYLEREKEDLYTDNVYNSFQPEIRQLIIQSYKEKVFESLRRKIIQYHYKQLYGSQIQELDKEISQLRKSSSLYIKCELCSNTNQQEITKLPNGIFSCRACVAPLLAACTRCGRPRTEACGLYCHKTGGARELRRYTTTPPDPTEDGPLGFLSSVLWDDGVTINGKHYDGSHRPNWTSQGPGRFLLQVANFEPLAYSKIHPHPVKQYTIPPSINQQFKQIYNEIAEKYQTLDEYPNLVKGKAGSRAHILFSNTEYTFANRTFSPDGSNRKFRNLLRQIFGLSATYNACLAVLYLENNSTQAGLNLHKDDEPIHANDRVLTVTIQGEAEVVLTDNQKQSRKTFTVDGTKAYLINHQNNLLHGTNKQPITTKPRISLTFRNFKY